MKEAALDLESKIEARSAEISVIGLGYVGLPLAVSLAEAGSSVTGIDIDRARSDAINHGDSYVQDVSPERFAPLVSNNGRTSELEGRLSATIPCHAYCSISVSSSRFCCSWTQRDRAGGR